VCGLVSLGDHLAARPGTATTHGLFANEHRRAAARRARVAAQEGHAEGLDLEGWQREGW
jgi:hypothetical protein